MPSGNGNEHRILAAGQQPFLLISKLVTNAETLEGIMIPRHLAIRPSTVSITGRSHCPIASFGGFE
jgi:hypothetical protein